MSRFYSYLNSAAAILSSYNGNEPFASYLKKYFSLHKKFGSKDRKHVTHLSYCYFRLGNAFTEKSLGDKILIASFFCFHQSNEILQEIKPEWNDNVTLSFHEKQRLVGVELKFNEIFTWQNELSDAIEKEAFILSHLKQPDLFLRVRPGKEKIILEKLNKSGIEFRMISDNCFAMPNSSKIDKLIAIDEEAVIQDYSSQRIGEFFLLLQCKTSLDVWDCCSASGGKSILATDVLGDINLTVTDIRESILSNLRKRFAEAGIRDYTSYVTDLSKTVSNKRTESFDLIIADVPCSGSGTWSRTPEQLIYFDGHKIKEYQALQKNILSNVAEQLKPGGYLLYITCSVFKQENEEVVSFIIEKLQLRLVKMELLKGYDKKADTMFAALLWSPL